MLTTKRVSEMDDAEWTEEKYIEGLKEILQRTSEEGYRLVLIEDSSIVVSTKELNPRVHQMILAFIEQLFLDAGEVKDE